METLFNQSNNFIFQIHFYSNSVNHLLKHTIHHMDIHRQEAKLRWFHVPPPTLKINKGIMGLASARNCPAQHCRFTGLSPLGGETLGQRPGYPFSKLKRNQKSLEATDL